MWVRPLVVCLLSIVAAFAARLANGIELGDWTPDISADSIETLLSIMASSMLAVATFAVGSMVSAYAAVSNSATPRAFALVVADDISQNALSTFIGSFIFSLVALIALKNGYYDDAGRLTLFVMTISVFGVVILTFVRWVDRIARLGRVGSTIDSVEAATAAALRRRAAAPTLGAVPAASSAGGGDAVYGTTAGYVQHVDTAALQSWAEQVDGRVRVVALPGTMTTPDRPLAYVHVASGTVKANDMAPVRDAFRVGSTRHYDNDPRFGMVVLAEIAGRALSPAVNDPGTAINVLGVVVRLFQIWSTAPAAGVAPVEFDRVEAPALSARDLLDDAVTAIGRDGAGSVEVVVRLQKTLAALAAMGTADLPKAAEYHAALALRRAERAMSEPHDIAAVRDATMAPVVREARRNGDLPA